MSIQKTTPTEEYQKTLDRLNELNYCDSMENKLTQAPIFSINSFEYIILKKQATISAITDLAKWIVLIIYPYLLIKLNNRLIAEKLYTTHEVATNFVMVMLCLIFVSNIAIMITNLDNMINGFFNKEFWILQKHSELNKKQ